MKRNSPTALNPKFAALVTAFTSEARVTYGGEGFGSRGLRVDGRIFAMLNTRDQFVVKLPRARVAALVQKGQAVHFSPTGRPMQEWAVITSERLSWMRLAREAYAFVGGARQTTLSRERARPGTPGPSRPRGLASRR